MLKTNQKRKEAKERNIKNMMDELYEKELRQNELNILSFKEIFKSVLKGGNE